MRSRLQRQEYVNASHCDDDDSGIYLNSHAYIYIYMCNICMVGPGTVVYENLLEGKNHMDLEHTGILHTQEGF